MENSHIVDCDGHLVEPPDLWERYLDGGPRAKAPRLVIASARFESRWRAGSPAAGGQRQGLPRPADGLVPARRCRPVARAGADLAAIAPRRDGPGRDRHRRAVSDARPLHRRRARPRPERRDLPRL